uniref:DUF1985 domain-containing protein n=1 Tax=Lactuca sativa TaxID=4236 RepID=A0A9R1WNB0_LACSA|nr:hypothetical protein LSAT_V11C100042880 [Lactuca sativa]
MFLCFLQHDFIFEVLDGVRRDIFRDTVFGYLLDVPRLQGDRLLFHKMFLHQIRPDPVLSPDGIKRLHFRVGNTKMVYWPEEFCLIIGFNFGEYPKNIGKKMSEKLVTSKKRCLLRERLFSNHTNSSVKIDDLKSLILNQTFLEVDDADAVRVCLMYILCESFLGKEINDRRRQTLKYSVLGFTGPIRIWIYEMLPAVRACGLVLRKNRDMPRMKRWSETKKIEMG